METEIIGSCETYKYKIWKTTRIKIEHKQGWI